MATALPAASAWTGAAVSEGDFKAAMTALRAFLAGTLGTTGETRDALITLGALFASGCPSVTAAQNVTAAHRGKALICNGTFSLSLDAVATLKEGFAFAVMNDGSGTITLDPNLTETIDGATTLALSAGESAIVVCNGTLWKTFARKKPLSSSDVTTALGFTPAPASGGAYVAKDQGYNAIGSYCYALCMASPPATNGTIAGSSLRSSGVSASGPNTTGGSLPGTWRLLGFLDNSNANSLFQRVS